MALLTKPDLTFSDTPQRGAEATMVADDRQGPRVSREPLGRPAVSGTLAETAGQPEPR